MITTSSNTIKLNNYSSLIGCSSASTLLMKGMMYGNNSSDFSSFEDTNSYMNTNDAAVIDGGTNFYGRSGNPIISEADKHYNFLTNYNSLSPTLTDELDNTIKSESFDNSIDMYDIPLTPNATLIPLPVEAPSKKFRCSYCDKLFAKKQQLQNHTKTHTKEKNFMCETCLKTFIHKQQLANHEKTHIGSKEFKCSFCDKCFMLKQQLQIHIKIHTGEKNFACNMCVKAFITKQQLQNHVNSHLGLKRFTCSECHKKFAHKQQLERHTKNHVLKQNHNCTECDGKFLTKTAYNEHVTEMHANSKKEIFVNSTC